MLGSQKYLVTFGVCWAEYKLIFHLVVFVGMRFGSTRSIIERLIQNYVKCVGGMYKFWQNFLKNYLSLIFVEKWKWLWFLVCVKLPQLFNDYIYAIANCIPFEKNKTFSYPPKNSNEQSAFDFKDKNKQRPLLNAVWHNKSLT